MNKTEYNIFVKTQMIFSHFGKCQNSLLKGDYTND